MSTLAIAQRPATGLGFRRQPRQRCTALAVASLLGLVGLLAPFRTAFAGGALRPPSTRRLPSARLAATRSLQVDGTVEPLGSHVLVRIGDPEQVTEGGLLLAKKERPQAGTVVAVGPGEADHDSGVHIPLVVKPGAKVTYSKYSKYSDSGAVSVGGVDHALVQEDDIFAIYSGDGPTLAELTIPRGKVLVKLLDAEQVTDSGILLSKTAAKHSTTVGEVVAVGAGEILPNGEPLSPPVEVGDMVRFRYGDEVELDLGDRFSIVKLSNCIARWRSF